ncbi:DUF4340 domain-containing protein [Borrelia sp. BU AG58]|uniref:DUF4340 domain-containing protein n=1 Tax=Borrelia sp. BU AG58 TaxID=2887345 RepID=UPI001E2F17B8|nr:DUF4340 domain-containing protein [Borrelia sp. BU AG58]UER67894.1 DUF4340 domain-containing protein [Borrelia sp. BU AG58]
MDKKGIFLGKREYMKIAIILILLSLFLLGIIFSNKNQVNRLLQEKLVEIDFGQIAKIETELEGILTKTEKGWELKYNDFNLPIDERRVTSMIQALEDLQKNKLVSRDPKKHKELGIKEKPDFKFFDDKNNLMTEIFIGNSGEGDSRLSYIKKSDNNVYLTNNIFLSYKGNSYNTFANTKLFREENSNLEKLSLVVINKPNKDEEDAIQNNYNVSRKDGLYFFNEELLKKEKPLQIIKEYTTDGFEIDKTKINEHNLQYNIEVTWSNKSVNNIDVYFSKNEKDRDILLKKDTDDYYYITNKWTFFDVFNLEKNIKTGDTHSNDDHTHEYNDHPHSHHDHHH